MVIKLVLSFPVLPSSRRERERERGWGLFTLLLLYYMYCLNVFFSFNVACVYCLFLIVPWDVL